MTTQNTQTDTLVATDDGTHSGPAKFFIFRGADGKLYGKSKFGGNPNYGEGRYTVADIEAKTKGYIRWFKFKNAR